MSTQKFKKGFTLIELMVVIVIIGILAAIAIPKLFGMSAKAKASEVAPAAGTWVKLQQAYSLEIGGYGTFVQIAYSEPKSNAFTYNSPTPTTTATGKQLSAVWEATSLDKLNDCTVGLRWRVTMSRTADDPEDGIVAAYVNDTTGACEAITPSFKNLSSPTAPEADPDDP